MREPRTRSPVDWWCTVVYRHDDPETDGGPREVDRILGPFLSYAKAKHVERAIESRGGEATAQPMLKWLGLQVSHE